MSAGREKRARGVCSGCDREIALTSVTGVIGYHNGDQEHGRRCSGMGKPAADAASLEARLFDLITNLHEYIEVRAQKLVSERERQGRP